MNTCRLCKNFIRTSEMLVRHPSNRRYAVHAACGLRRLGKEFVDKWVRDWQLAQLPALALADTGLLDYVDQKIKEGAAKGCKVVPRSELPKAGPPKRESDDINRQFALKIIGSNPHTKAVLRGLVFAIAPAT